MKVIRGAAIGLIVFGFILGFIEAVRFGAAWDMKLLADYKIHWDHMVGMIACVSLGLLIYERGRVREGITTFVELWPGIIPLLRSIRPGGNRDTDKLVPPPDIRE